MHLTLAALISAAGIVSLLIVAAGIIGASFRVSRNTQTLANYREAAQSWELKANSQENEIEDLQRRVANLQDDTAKKDLQITNLQEQITALRELLLQRATFETLEMKLAEALQLGAENRTMLKELLARPS